MKRLATGRLHLIAPSAPPKICGVGDHGLLLGKALASRTPTTVHCGQTDPRPVLAPLDWVVDFDQGFSSSLAKLAKTGDFRASETIFFQYTNFAYGRYGFNPWLAPALRRWRSRGLRIATMFHETYTDQTGTKGALMRAWQRVFFRQVGRASDLCLFSVEPWTLRYRPWFPQARVETLAVGSNIPRLPVDRAAQRRKLSIPEGVPVLCAFGGTHPSRLFEWIEGASRHLTRRGVDHRILRIGPNAGEVAARLAGAPLIDLGILDPDEVSRALSCADVFLSPISDGASSRRGSLLAGLGHALPCVTTLGAASDDLFRNAAGEAFLTSRDADDFAERCLELTLDPRKRTALGEQALSFHDRNFGWEAIADRFLGLLQET